MGLGPICDLIKGGVQNREIGSAFSNLCMLVLDWALFLCGLNQNALFFYFLHSQIHELHPSAT